MAFLPSGSVLSVPVSEEYLQDRARQSAIYDFHNLKHLTLTNTVRLSGP